MKEVLEALQALSGVRFLIIFVTICIVTVSVSACLASIADKVMYMIRKDFKQNMFDHD